MNHKSSYSSFYGLYGPFESNPWKDDINDKEQFPLDEEEDKEDSSSLILLMTIIQFSIILPNLPILNLIYGIISYILGHIFTSILMLPLSTITASFCLQNIPIVNQKNFFILLGFLSFFYSLPAVFKIYHYIIERTIIFSIIFWISLCIATLFCFSIAMYNWVRLSWKVSSNVLSKIHKSKSMPLLKTKSSEFRKSSKSLRESRSHYFSRVSSNGKWSARIVRE